MVSEFRSVSPWWLALPLQVCDNIQGFQSRTPGKLHCPTGAPPPLLDRHRRRHRGVVSQWAPCWLFGREDAQEALDTAPARAGLLGAGVGDGSSPPLPLPPGFWRPEMDVQHFKVSIFTSLCQGVRHPLASILTATLPPRGGRFSSLRS